MYMQKLLGTLFTINHPDEEIILRSRNLLRIAIGLVCAGFFFAFFWAETARFAAIGAGIFGAICLIVIWLAHRAQVGLGGSLMLGSIVLLVSLIMLLNQYVHDAPFYMVIPVVFAGTFFSPRQVILVAVLTMLVIVPTTFFVLETSPYIQELERGIASNATVLAVLFALISYMTSSSIYHFLHHAQESKQEATSLAASLERMNTELEHQVAQRTTALEDTLKQQQLQAQELQTALDQQKVLSETIMTLSLPLLPVRHDVLVVPVIGNIDAPRADHLRHSVLGEVERSHTRAIILDITGVAIVDRFLAETIVGLARAAKLLGAHTVLVGIRPEVAQTIVSLGADLHLLKSAATLQEGLEMISEQGSFLRR